LRVALRLAGKEIHKLNFGRSGVIPAMLLHQGTNHVGNYFRQPSDVLPGGDDWQMPRGVVYWIVAVAVLAWTKGRLGVSRPAAGA
jgi:hypothetical protein